MPYTQLLGISELYQIRFRETGRKGEFKCTSLPHFYVYRAPGAPRES